MIMVDRFNFPNNIVRVTAGFGGEALLVFGKQKTAIIDCGMAYCHEKMIENIEKALASRGRNTLDYILLSHSHYDHIGALPYIKKHWKDIKVCGAKKCQEVFESETAQKTIKHLGEYAKDLYGDEKERAGEILTKPMDIDIILCEGDKLQMCDKEDEEYFYVLETKGHTDCSLTFVLEPEGIMFTSESTGVMGDADYIHTAMLKSYKDTIESAKKCKAYGPKRIISPHFGIVEEQITNRYFDLYIEMAHKERDLVLSLYQKNSDPDKILEEYTKVYWNEQREKEQPKEAFLINAVPIIRTIIKECL